MHTLIALYCVLHTAADPAPTASDAQSGVLVFEILDEAGEPMPGRLTFIDQDGGSQDLFPNADASPDDLAVRRHAAYTLSGKGAITVPTGSWDVYATHGLEWSMDSTHIDISPGSESQWTANLVHEIDTTNWVSGDFHLHTLTHSGHGDSNMPERIISIVGEGVEFAVATDHNHNTDYDPTIERLGAEDHLTAVIGNEVSTSYGHLNAFPFDPNAAIVNQKLDAQPLFAMIRAEENEWDVVPIIQINHPRWGGIDYFGKRGLDPVTGEATDDRWSWDFDSIEVLNENEGWGFYDSEVDDINTRAGKHSVLQDWYNMLNAGRRIAAIGNSDSHTVISNIAGVPRNFVYVGSDDASNIDPAAVANAIRGGQVSATTGPFVRMTADGQPMGSTIAALDGVVDIHLDIQSASWIPIDRIRIIKNGDVAATLEVPREENGPTRLRPRFHIPVERDCWIAAIVDGQSDLSPYIIEQSRPILPIAIANPIYIDADDDGVWTPPSQWARNTVDDGDLASVLAAAEGSSPSEVAMLVLAATGDEKINTQMIRYGLSHDDRGVRLAACRAAAASSDASLLPLLSAVVDRPDSDHYLAFSGWAASDTIEPDVSDELFWRFVDRFGWSNARRFASEHALRLGGDFLREWEVAGYFPAADMKALGNAQAPEPGIVHITAPKTKQGGPLEWQTIEASESGFVDLATIVPVAVVYERAIAYARCWVWSLDDREVRFTIGSDDGCRVWVNDTLVLDDPEWQYASRDRRLGTMSLRAGWNPVLVKVLNGTKTFGFYFRVIDESVRSSSQQPAYDPPGVDNPWDLPRDPLGPSENP